MQTRLLVFALAIFTVASLVARGDEQVVSQLIEQLQTCRSDDRDKVRAKLEGFSPLSPEAQRELLKVVSNRSKSAGLRCQAVKALYSSTPDVIPAVQMEIVRLSQTRDESILLRMSAVSKMIVRQRDPIAEEHVDAVLRKTVFDQQEVLYFRHNALTQILARAQLDQDANEIHGLWPQLLQRLKDHQEDGRLRILIIENVLQLKAVADDDVVDITPMLLEIVSNKMESDHIRIAALSMTSKSLKFEGCNLAICQETHRVLTDLVTDQSIPLDMRRLAVFRLYDISPNCGETIPILTAIIDNANEPKLLRTVATWVLRELSPEEANGRGIVEDE